MVASGKADNVKQDIVHVLRELVAYCIQCSSYGNARLRRSGCAYLRAEGNYVCPHFEDAVKRLSRLTIKQRVDLDRKSIGILIEQLEQVTDSLKVLLARTED